MCAVSRMIVALALSFLCAPSAAAQSEWTYRIRFVDEVTTERSNPGSPFADLATTPLWDVSNEALATGDAAWERGRLKLGAGVGLRARDGGPATVRTREAYARVSALPWLDVEGGKRLIRWGTGYAFSPTGLLNPPRDATDPQDRLRVNEGMTLVRADLYRGSTAVTLALARPRARTATDRGDGTRVAARLRTSVGGVEFAFVAAGTEAHGPAWGANFTHVVGSQLEWHGELLVHEAASAWRRILRPDRSANRSVSGLIGLQYTFTAGLNVVLEYYRDAQGLDAESWERLVAGARTLRERDAAVRPVTGPSTAARPWRRDFLFVRAARATADPRFAPEVIAIAGLEDGGLTLVPALTVSVGGRVQLYARAVHPTGAPGSASATAPLKASLATGLSLRF